MHVMADRGSHVREERAPPYPGLFTLFHHTNCVEGVLLRRHPPQAIRVLALLECPLLLLEHLGELQRGRVVHLTLHLPYPENELGLGFGLG